jgi:hypothetical protein
MNECYLSQPTPASAGQRLIETQEKSQEIRSHNIIMLRTLRSFLINSPPILTNKLELGNLRRNNSNDFVYKDFGQYMGKSF